MTTDDESADPPPRRGNGPPTYAGPPDRENRGLAMGPSGASLNLDGGEVDVGEMVKLLESVGVTPDEIVEARAHHHLELLAIEHLVLPEIADHDVADVEEATGLSTEQVAQLWRSLGFPEPRPGDRIFTDVDLDMLRTIGQLLHMGWIDDELTVQMARVIGSSLSRVASALIDSIDPSEPGGDRDLDDAFATAAPLLMPMLLQVMDYVWRRHVQAEARARMAREHAGANPDQRAVGFADLIGFTALSQQISAHRLAQVVDRFETIAYDTVGRCGGRVVKMIGDEVMFAVSDERGAVEIALSLSEVYRNDDELSDVRVGLASGNVLQREADLFGPVVNRASRIVNIAFPGTVVCSGELHEALDQDESLVWKSIGSRSLKDIGKVPLYVVRRTGTEPQPKPSWQAAEARRAERREAVVGELTGRRWRRGEGT
ncbi:MAG: adenylate/guanylate cyclase domain-containing protein [Acidimicrobiales bacterium]